MKVNASSSILQPTRAQLLLRIERASPQHEIEMSITGPRKEWKRGLALFITSTIAFAARAERINQEGRILGPAPSVAAPTLFNTPQADAIVSAMQIFPVTNAWNEAISDRPLLANSSAMIAQIKAELSSSRQTLRPFYEMNYVLVPDSQPRATIPFLDYPDESDLDGGTFPNGSYPIPPNMPIETWPKGTGSLTLQQWQMDVTNTGGDRHGVIVAPGAGSIWEMWQMKLAQSGWQASTGAKFVLNFNALRPAGWTSGDAAGLPMFPALVRYDECERGMVEHALRLVVAKTRREYIYPATHFASVISATSTNYPAMGQRLRLKSSFVIPGGWTIAEKAVLGALKKYGAIVADNGGFFSVSVCPDDRFSSTAFNNLSTIDISNFEVIETTGPNEGPRSSGAPTANAGADQNVSGMNAALAGSVVDPNGTAAVQWRLYSGPAPVSFTSPSSANTMVAFGQPGSYTFMLSADDGIHAVAYDAVVVDAATTPAPTPAPSTTPTPTPTSTPTSTPSPTPTPAVTPTTSPAPTATPTPTVMSTPTIRVSVSPAQVTEGSDAIFTVSSFTPLSQPITVSYSMRGTAQSGTDYPLSGASGAVTISAGQSSASIVLHANVDNVKEKNETAVMALRSGAGYQLPRPAKATLTIAHTGR